MAEVLDGEYDDVEEAAKAALVAAEAIFKERAKYVVVGQLLSTRERHKIDPSDAEAIKVSLGWYATRGTAQSAAESLWSNAGTGETYRTWVLNCVHETPAEFHKTRKQKIEADQAKAKAAQTERIQQQIQQRREQAAEIARALREEKSL